MKTLLRFLFVLMSLSVLQAQDASPRKDAGEMPRRPVTKVFKVIYNIYELEDGKRINERSYSLPVRTLDGSARSSSLKINNRVPVTSKETPQGSEFMYLDVGLNLECDVTEQSDKFIVFTGLDLSYVISADQIAGPHLQGQPIIRSTKENSTTLVYPGKATLVTSIDDINSKKRMQLEVTVTRIE
jgi:hypothetical protein